MQDKFEKSVYIYEKIKEDNDFIVYKRTKKLERFCDSLHYFYDTKSNQDLGQYYYDLEYYFDGNNNPLENPIPVYNRNIVAKRKVIMPEDIKEIDPYELESNKHVFDPSTIREMFGVEDE